VFVFNLFAAATADDEEGEHERRCDDDNGQPKIGENTNKMALKMERRK